MENKIKILVAPDSFKESMTSVEASNAIEEGIRRVKKNVEFIKIPMADGGEGTTYSLTKATGGKLYYKDVKGPLGKNIRAYYGVLGDGKTAVIEMASASGIELISPEKRNPMISSTYGTGQLIKECVEKGFKKIIIGLGGSATNDGGIGMLCALGINFLDKNNKILNCLGEDLNCVKKIDTKGKIKELENVEIIIASDVNSPLYGENGAAYVYGKQKGASDKMIKILDEGLKNYSEIVKNYFNKDFSKVKGSGAAGGLGFAILAFLNGKIYSGIDIMIKYSNIEKSILESQIVISGEGKLDFQTYNGKVPYGIGSLGKKYGKTVFIFSGLNDKGWDKNIKEFADDVICISNEKDSVEKNIRNGYKNLANSVERKFREIWEA